MEQYFVNKENLMEIAESKFCKSNIILDIGPGIRPQQFVKPKTHICVDPHLEYLNIINAELIFKRTNIKTPHYVQNTAVNINSDNEINYVFINDDWEGIISKLPEKSVDVIFLVDVIEHLEKEKGEILLERSIKIAREQINIFTPYGFIEQEHDSDKDAWGLHGAKWQKHLSGWMPEDFPKNWEFIIATDFHSENNMGEKYRRPKGAFLAIYQVLRHCRRRKRF
jgi:hypothetical protein